MSFLYIDYHSFYAPINSVPGVVSNFTAENQVTSVTFDWGLPEEPNGIIIAYELSYRVNSSTPFTNNITDVRTIAFTIDLAVNTNVSDVSIRAYTSVGPGDVATANNVLIPATPLIRKLTSIDIIIGLSYGANVSAVVRNVQVMQVPDSETSVIVSWDRSSSSAVTGYTVYYSLVSGRKRQANEMSVTVPNTESSVRIDGLLNGASYQFQVTVTVMFRGESIEEERTEQNVMSMFMVGRAEPEGCMGGMLFLCLAASQSMINSVDQNLATNPSTRDQRLCSEYIM